MAASAQFFAPNNSSTTYSQAAYNAAIKAGATPAQAAQYAGSQNQYADDPAEAKDIVPGESASAAEAREKKAGLPVGGTNFAAGTPESLAQEGTAAKSGTAATGSGTSSLQPTYLSQLFPNGLPQASTTNVSNVPQVGAPSTSGITSSIMAALQPQFAQQDQAETESLANAGIVGGSTTGAMGALGNQQQTQALSAMAPYILQGDQMQQTAQQDNQQTALQGGEFNASAANANSQFNIADLIKGAEYDSSLQAQQAQTLAGYQNQDWLAQLGLQGDVITGGQTGQTNAYEPVYQQSSPTDLSGLGTTLASAFAPTSNMNGTPTSATNSSYGAVIA